MKKYIYNTYESSNTISNEELNKFGDDGWLLVSESCVITPKYTYSRGNCYSYIYRFIKEYIENEHID